ncbi:MAG: hypothetical protein RLN72_00540 [Henriciella sp.]
MTRMNGQGPAGIDLSSKTSSRTSTDEEDGHLACPSVMQLKKIDAALRRLDAGRFGHCLYCGDQIAIRRLTRDPATESCTVCDED